MATFEEEFNRLVPLARRISGFFLLGKEIVIKGKENFVESGPNIIIGNHIGTIKDVATLVKIIPRPIFFTSNKMIFDRNEFNLLIRRHLKRHLKNFGLFVDLVLSPIKSLFTRFVSTNINKVGAIPVDMDHGKRYVLEQCHEYLINGRAIIALQGRGRVMKKEPNPYVSTFKRGTSILSYNLHMQEGISIPVTPFAMFGTHIPFLVPAKIKVNVGKPMYIADYISGGFTDTVEKFRDALEKRVKALFFDIIKS